MRRLVLLLSLLAFFVNPGFACSPGEEDFNFGEAEMRAAVEGTWQITFGGDASTSELTVEIRESPGRLDSGMAVGSGTRARAFIRAAAACGSRTFLRGAGACMDMSEMPLDVSYVSGDSAYQGVHMGGIFRAFGTSFSGGYIDISFGGSALSADVNANGTASPLRDTAETMVRVGP